MSKVLVLGAKGRLGSAFQNLVFRDPSLGAVFVFADRSSVDLTDQEATIQFFRQERPEVVINFAAQVVPQLDRETENHRLYESNLKMFQSIHAASTVAGVRRLLQAGSYHIFHRNVPVPYSTAVGPKMSELNFENSYAAVKSTEYLFGRAEAFQSIRSGVGLTLMVMPNLFGPDGPKEMTKEHFIGASIRRMLFAERNKLASLQFRGAKDQVREYLYTYDAARQIIRLALEPSDPTPYFVISSGIKLTQSECLNEIKSLTRFRGDLIFDSETDQPNHMYFAEPTFKPTPFRAALGATVEWYEETWLKGM